MENRAPTRKPPAKIGYARVSTKDQTLDLQVDALKKAGCIKVLTEVVGRVVECQAAGDQSPVAGPTGFRPNPGTAA